VPSRVHTLTLEHRSQILCPMRNAIEHIWHFFHLVDQLSYPRHLVHLGILASDSTDRTYARAIELADERQYGTKYRRNRYGRISVFEKDFARPSSTTSSGDGGDGGDGERAAAYEGENVGAERHEYAAQVGRRQLLAKSRTWLLGAALAPEVDWVLWLDVDLVDFEPQLVERLMRFAKGEEGEGEGADVVVPNCVWKTYNEMGCVSLSLPSPLPPTSDLHRTSALTLAPPAARTTATTGSRRPSRERTSAPWARPMSSSRVRPPFSLKVFALVCDEQTALTCSPRPLARRLSRPSDAPLQHRLACPDRPDLAPLAALVLPRPLAAPSLTPTVLPAGRPLPPALLPHLLLLLVIRPAQTRPAHPPPRRHRRLRRPRPRRGAPRGRRLSGVAARRPPARDRGVRADGQGAQARI